MNGAIATRDVDEASRIIIAAYRSPDGERELTFANPAHPTFPAVVRLAPRFAHKKPIDGGTIHVVLPNGDVIDAQTPYSAACAVAAALSLLSTPIAARTARRGA